MKGPHLARKAFEDEPGLVPLSARLASSVKGTQPGVNSALVGLGS